MNISIPPTSIQLSVSSTQMPPIEHSQHNGSHGLNEKIAHAAQKYALSRSGESQKALEQLLSSESVPLLRLDPESDPIACNAALRELLNLPESESFENVMDLLPESLRTWLIVEVHRYALQECTLPPEVLHTKLTGKDCTVTCTPIYHTRYILQEAAVIFCIHP